jgi:hypothetical protein
MGNPLNNKHLEDMALHFNHQDEKNGRRITSAIL